MGTKTFFHKLKFFFVNTLEYFFLVIKTTIYAKVNKKPTMQLWQKNVLVLIFIVSQLVANSKFQYPLTFRLDFCASCERANIPTPHLGSIILDDLISRHSFPFFSFWDDILIPIEWWFVFKNNLHDMTLINLYLKIRKSQKDFALKFFSLLKKQLTDPRGNRFFFSVLYDRLPGRKDETEKV